MTEFKVEQYRGETVESVHRVSAAVVSGAGKLVGSSGDPDLVTFMRSAAKPLQVLAFVESGAIDHFGVTESELALACASHNSEVAQVEVARGFLKKVGFTGEALACGPHPSLFHELGRYQGPGAQVPELEPPTRISNNCSGKHSAMLGLSKFSGWDASGYQALDHPVQRSCLENVAKWSDMREEQVGLAVDGCGVATFALPLRNMAMAFARLIAREGAVEKRIMDAMLAHPELIAGSHRMCTSIMQAFPGRIVAKVGAGGVYLAGLVDEKIGIALKAEDGGARAAEVSLLALLAEMGWEPDPRVTLPRFWDQKVLNTRKEVVGCYRTRGHFAFS